MTTVGAPMCTYCKHLQAGLKCRAFPDRIPDAILQSEWDHRRPFIGDHGVRFEPVDKESAEIVASMFDGERDQ